MFFRAFMKNMYLSFWETKKVSDLKFVD